MEDIQRIENQLFDSIPVTLCANTKAKLRDTLHEQIIFKTPRVSLEPINAREVLLNLHETITRYERRLSLRKSIRQMTVSKRITTSTTTTPSPTKRARGRPSQKNSEKNTCPTPFQPIHMQVPIVITRKKNLKFNVSIDLDKFNIAQVFFENLYNRTANPVNERNENENNLNVEVNSQNDSSTENAFFSNILEQILTDDNNPDITNNNLIINETNVICQRNNSTLELTRRSRKKTQRNPGRKNRSKKFQEKSDLALYVEAFSNDCNNANEVMPSVSSAIPYLEISQHQVTDVNNSQVAYYLNGGMSFQESSVQEVANINHQVQNEEFSMPFDDIVNYIDNTTDDGNGNEIARVLDGNAVNDSDNQYSIYNKVVTINERVDIYGRLRPRIDHVMKRCEANMIVAHGAGTTRLPNSCAEVLDLSKKTYIPIHLEEDTSNHLLDLSAKSSSTSPSFNNTKFSKNSSFTKNNDRKTSLTSSSNDSGIDMSNDLGFEAGLSMPSLDDDNIFTAKNNIVNVPETIMKKNVDQVVNPSMTEIGEISKDEAHEDSAGNLVEPNVDINSNEMLATKNDKIGKYIDDCTLKELTQLEIEEMIDNSAFDYSEIDDDLISLTTSSMGSPQILEETRIIDEIVEEAAAANILTDDSNMESSKAEAELICLKNSPTTTTKTAKNYSKKQSTEELTKGISEFSDVLPQLSPVNLQSFKIPKKTSQLMPECFQNTSTTDNEKSDTSTKGNYFNTQIAFDSVPTTTTTSTRNLFDVTKVCEILQIFGCTCPAYLRNNCKDQTCFLVHEPNNLNNVKEFCQSLAFDSLNMIYKFICRYKLLFATYFQIFCDLFANRNYRLKLLNMIEDCELQRSPLFLKIIYQNLIKCGFNKINACRHLLNHCHDKSLPTLNILTEIIIDSDVTKFVDIIDTYLTVPNYRLQLYTLNLMAGRAMQDNCNDLIAIIMKGLLNVDPNEFVTMNPPELVKLLELVKDGVFE